MTSNLKSLLSSGQDEAVSVNQRALVEKILARYSGENTLFRELLQNADDASATAVEIHFRTSTDDASATTLHSAQALPNLKTHKIGSYLVKNDGIVFREEDWNRLKKIAEGNPDESKIGAFGVGFYSLFSICDEPVVVSGEKLMGFFWKDGGDQLYVKTAVNTNSSNPESMTAGGKPWTSFSMELREQAPMPDPHEFARFLATCLGFTANVKSISMHFDGHLLFRITKTFAPSRLLPLNRSLGVTSRLKLLQIVSTAEVPLQLRAEVSRWLTRFATKPKPPPSIPIPGPSSLALGSAVNASASLASSFASKMLSAFSSSTPLKASPSSTRASTPVQLPPSVPAASSDPFVILPSALFLRIVSATLKVTPTPHFAAEMVRATKKSLPTNTSYSLIWTGKDEYDASYDYDTASDGIANEASGRSVFEGLLSRLDRNGRVFIGFPTFQTTGCAASVAARFVSTVERESLDFQARYVADWNRELLWAGGVLARTIYESEMAEIAKIFKTGGPLDVTAKLKLQHRALHVMQFFTFSASTPSPVVGADTEASFFSSPNITLPTQLGPLPASSVRLPNPALSGFVKSIPIIPTAVSDAAPQLVASYRAKNLVRDISLEDVLGDLGANALTISEAIEAFKWWMGLASNRSYNPALLSKLKEAAMLSVPELGKEEEVSIRPLGGFKTALNPKTIPADLPLPEETLPFALTRGFSHQDLSSIFQFEELTLVDWVKFLVSPPMVGTTAPAETNILVSPHFAEKVLNVLARGWTSLSAPQQKEIVDFLSTKPFIPTRHGSRLPKESYFSNVNLFTDLAVVTLPSGTSVKGALEKFLVALDVRRHVDLQLVFSRLLGQGDWSHADVTRYLVSVKSTLQTSEIQRLRETAWLLKEGEAKVVGADGISRVVRRPANQLFEPTEILRTLGLPLLDWPAPHRWRSSSDEARLLFDLNLQRTPSVEQVLQIASSSENPVRQEAALRYFLTEYETSGFNKAYSPAKHNYAFIPSTHDNQETLRKPGEVFANPKAALLGFPVVVERLQSDAVRLQIALDPAPDQLVAALIRKPPADVGNARLIFSYLSSQVSKFSSGDLKSLQLAKIIPIPSADGNTIPLVAPAGCFFSSDSGLPTALKAFFSLVPDFGAASKPFLMQIGVKESPSPQAIAALLVERPERVFDLSGSSERYLSILRMLASNYSEFPFALKSRMKLSPFFLGTQRIATPSTKPGTILLADDDDDEGGGNLVYKLARASELVINDDPTSFRVFEGDLVACPQEDALETLALALGGPRISKLVSEEFRVSGEPIPTKRATDIYRVVVERGFLFLAERQQYSKSDLKHDAEWLKKHLEVVEVRSIQLIYTLASPTVHKKNQQIASACVKVAPKTGNLQLFIAGDIDIDYFEVAHSLCRHLLVKPRSQDDILLLTILTTSLKNLKRRGFNVDRILNARQAEREMADQRLRKERVAAQEAAASRQAEPQEPHIDRLAGHQKQLEELFPAADPSYLRALLEAEKENHVANVANILLAGDYPKRRGQPPEPIVENRPLPTAPQTENSGIFSQFKRKLRPEAAKNPPSGERPPRPTNGEGFPGAFPVPDRKVATPAPSGTGEGEHDTGSTPTSTDAIKSNVLKAIQASRPDSANSFNNAVDKTTVRESEETYCDATHAADLVFVTEVAGLRFFTSRDIVDGPAFVHGHHAALVRYVTQVVKPIGEVFKMDPRSLHIFADSTGPLIAFNRNGAIYLNFRYYQAWHDEQVLRGAPEEALISNFHSIAHELAHNLVKPHDSQFAFYASSIAELNFLRMAQLVEKLRAPPTY